MRRKWPAALLIGFAGCHSTLAVTPLESGTTRVFHGERIVGHYVSAPAYQHYMQAQLASLDGRGEEAADELRRALASDGESPYLHTRLAEELFALGRLDEARNELDGALRLEPNFAEAWVDLGRILMKLADTAGAEASFRHAIEVDRSCEEAYLSLAGLLRARGDLVHAEATYRTLLERLPTSASAHFQLAHAAGARGDLVGVEQELRRTLAVDPAHRDARLELGEILRADGRSDEAANELAQVYERSGHDPRIAEPLVAALGAAGRSDEAQLLLDALFDRAATAERALAAGWVFMHLHQSGRALQLADLALKSDSSSGAHLLRACALDEAGQPESAIAEARRIPSSSAVLPAAELRIGRILRDLGRFDEAAAGLQKAVATCERLPECDALSELMADVQERAGRAAQAEKFLSDALKARPESEALALALAAHYERAGMRQRALEVANSVLKRMPDSPGALNFVGYLEARAGVHLPEAQRLLERALGLRPTSGAIADSLGWLYLKQGRFDDSQRLLERAERLAPDDPEVMAHLGEVYLKRDDKTRAVEVYRRVLGLRPTESLRHAVEEQLLLIEAGRVGTR